MTSKKLDFTRPIKTRDGRDVVIYCTDAPDEDYPVHGRVGNGKDGPLTWMLDGTYLKGGPPATKDLVQPPTKISVRGFINVYRSNSTGKFFVGGVTTEPKTFEQSNMVAHNVSITIETEEGFGL